MVTRAGTVWENFTSVDVARLLRVLSLLQQRPDWTGPALAGRLGVGLRTIRRDIQRLRELGYPVDATPGVAGGYQLGIGAQLPPLLLDDDEAVAVVVGLRTAAATALSGITDSATTALQKLECLLSVSARERVRSLSTASAQASRTPPPLTDPAVLDELARACNQTRRARFAYTTRQGYTFDAEVEPLRLVHTGYCWYLVARDVKAGDWRTYRVDRIEKPTLTNHSFDHVDPPDPETFVFTAIAVEPYAYKARLRLHLPLAHAEHLVPRTVGVLSPTDDGDTMATELRIGGGDSKWMINFIIGLPCDVTVIEPDDLRCPWRRPPSAYSTLSEHSNERPERRDCVRRDRDRLFVGVRRLLAVRSSAGGAECVKISAWRMGVRCRRGSRTCRSGSAIGSLRATATSSTDRALNS